MALKCRNLLLSLATLGLTLAPAATQFGPFMPIAMSSMTDNIIGGMDRGAEALKRTLTDLNATAATAVTLAEDKVRSWYMPGLTSSWRWAVGYAQWLNPEVTSTQCPEDGVVARLLKEVEGEALTCVRDKVPRGVPEIYTALALSLSEINAFMQRVRVQAEECEEEAGLQGVMCKATRLAPMSAQIGVLGGQVGRLGGDIAILVDGSARHCTVTAAQTRESQALAANHITSECIKTTGGNIGNPELSRIYSGFRRTGVQLTSNTRLR